LKDSEPENQLVRFLQRGVWENGFDDKYLDRVNSVAIGSRIVAKTNLRNRGF
jgi:5-methylcytosine-specific restriction protein B